jgi:hypothetical protein
LALWAILAAFVLYFIAFLAPKLPELHARAERIRLQEITAEHESCCAKLNMGRGTPMYDQCILELQAFRAKVELRLADEGDF